MKLIMCRGSLLSRQLFFLSILQRDCKEEGRGWGRVLRREGEEVLPLFFSSYFSLAPPLCSCNNFIDFPKAMDSKRIRGTIANIFVKNNRSWSKIPHLCCKYLRLSDKLYVIHNNVSKKLAILKVETGQTDLTHVLHLEDSVDSLWRLSRPYNWLRSQEKAS